MADDQVPPVVAVVVTRSPGPWLEQCLLALHAQDYGEQLTTLVIDAGSSTPLAERVAAVAPEVYLHRLERNDGFGPSANVALDLVEGAAFLLFCHDDVVPDPDAVRRMVEEAFRSNAAIVAPKLVDFQQPDRLLQLGLGVDRFGAPLRRVQPGELDQSQHDEVRDVFAAPGACTLVRADLFAALGGFDPAITMLGEDVDLCWRARVAGARVVVAPAARVRHLEATASRQRPLPEARALQWRHELRAVLKNYGRLRRSVVVTELVALSLLEVVYFTAVGKRWRARLVVDAWRWNLARRAEVRAARRTIAASRRLSDREVCRTMDGGTFRLERYARRIAEGAVLERTPGSAPRRGGHERAPHPDLRPAAALTEAGSGLVARISSNRGPYAALAVAVALLVLGARSLFLGHLPLVGEVLPFPAPERLLGDFFGGWQDAGLQRTGPASPALGLIGLAGLVIGGGTSLIWKAVILASVVLGGLGAARLVRPFVSVPGRIGASIAYLFLPLAWNDLARGDALALVVFATTPWVLARLAEATMRPRRGLGAQSVGLGLLLALAGSLAPAVVPLTLEMAAALALATLAASGRRQWRAAARCCAVGAGGVAVSLALTLPWSITWLQPGGAWSLATGGAPLAGSGPSLAQVLAFDLGPIGRGPLGYALLLAGLITVLVGRGDRLEWGTRFVVVAVLAFAVAWVAGRGWLGAGGGDVRMLVAPAAACVAACVGLGVATVSADLASSGLGWRHAVGALCALAGLAGLIPVVGASGSGRFGLPTTGYDTVLSYLASGGGGVSATAGRGGASSGAAAPASGGSVLWLGEPDALPLVGWQVTPGLAAGISDGQPDGTRLFPSPSAGLMATLGRGVVQAESGLTVTLGSNLAAAGVRYVVVTTATAPVLAGMQDATAAPPPAGLVPSLAAQQDLRRLPGEGGAIVFADTAWRPSPAGSPILTSGGGTPAWLRGLSLAVSLVAAALAAAWCWRGRARRHSHRPAHRAPHRPLRPLAVNVPPPPPGADDDELVLSVRRR